MNPLNTEGTEQWLNLKYNALQVATEALCGSLDRTLDVESGGPGIKSISSASLGCFSVYLSYFNLIAQRQRSLYSWQLSWIFPRKGPKKSSLITIYSLFLTSV